MSDFGGWSTASTHRANIILTHYETHSTWLKATIASLDSIGEAKVPDLADSLRDYFRDYILGEHVSARYRLWGKTKQQIEELQSAVNDLVLVAIGDIHWKELARFLLEVIK